MTSLSSRTRSLGCAALLLAALASQPVSAQLVAPGDVYYKVHVDQTFKYHVFVYSYVAWENRDLEGDSLTFSAAHDSVQVNDAVSISSACNAAGGTFNADLDSDLNLAVDRGIWHQLINTMRVQVYVKGATGTPYRILVAGTGQVEVSRSGGRAGSLQPVNGTATASFMATTATIDSTGFVSSPVYLPYEYAGHTTTQIAVGADTYSYAGTYTFSAPTTITQTFCAIGCMISPASLNARAQGHVQMAVYPCTDAAGGTGFPCVDVPSDVAAMPRGEDVLAVGAVPNPFNPTTEISFAAPAGQPTRVEIYDVRGQLAVRLYEGVASGQTQTIAWRAAGFASGLYFVQVHSGRQVSTEKITLLK